MNKLKVVSVLFTAAVAWFASGCAETTAEEIQVVDGPTYWEDVEPIIAGKCSMCHQAAGVGPFSFDSYESVMAMRDAISVSVSNRSMPPWLADNSCGRIM